MKKNQLFLIIGIILLLSSCAASMPPTKLYNTLPTLTQSKFISPPEADEIIKSNKCKYIVKGRSYAVPLGFSTKTELIKGAKGIDEWVKLDGGNAYVLRNYKWIAIDNFGAAQLHLEFDTMICE